MTNKKQWSSWLRIESFAVFLTILGVYYTIGGSWWVFAGLILAPDLSMLGYLANKRVGAALYNAGHSYIGPSILVGFSLFASDERLVPYALIWVAHIGLDRALGYGLKSTSGFRNTHLGYVGKEATIANNEVA
ncbi:DUF4260 domain-containing protein [Altererythrobacter sp.]|nr:DUF4260 domain-containing protein [Altererythrobacter sp.]